MTLHKLIGEQDVDNKKDFIQRANNKSQNGYGGNFELRRQWDNGILLRSSYSIQYAKNADGSSLLYIPHHLYQLNLMAPLFTPEWRGGLDMQTLPSRDSLAGKVPGYTRLNLSLLYQPIKSVDLSASVYDLLNSNRIETIPEALTLMPQEGRTFRLKMEFRF
jgi:outer membrane receptor protein involved in Fe transport